MEDSYQPSCKEVGVFIVDVPGGGLEAYYVDSDLATCAEAVLDNGLFVAARFPDSPWLRLDVVSLDLLPVDEEFESQVLCDAVHVLPADPVAYFKSFEGREEEVDLESLCEAIDDMCSTEVDEQVIDLHPSLFAIPPRGHYLH